MASAAHSVYCFEVLSASLEKRHALDFKQVRSLWAQYEAALEPGHDDDGDEDGAVGKEEDAEMAEDDEEEAEEGNNEATTSTQRTLLPREISRLQAPSPASGSASSTPSNLSATSSQTGFSDASKTSSKSSFFSFARRSPVEKEEEYPLFVTWNTISHRGHKSLRGCIGTFEAQALSGGLRSYALTSAFDDTRFTPITVSELPTLSNSVTLLTNFTPCSNALDWDLGTHGIRISFSYHGKRYGATYLPDVAVEQGWTKEETIISLMRKAGWNGRSSDWRKMPDMRCVRYQGQKASIDYREWKEWRAWVDGGAGKGT